MNSKCYHITAMNYSCYDMQYVVLQRMNVSFISDKNIMTITIPLYRHVPGGHKQIHGSLQQCRPTPVLLGQVEQTLLLRG